VTSAARREGRGVPLPCQGKISSSGREKGGDCNRQGIRTGRCHEEETGSPDMMYRAGPAHSRLASRREKEVVQEEEGREPKKHRNTIAAGDIFAWEAERGESLSQQQLRRKTPVLNPILLSKKRGESHGTLNQRGVPGTRLKNANGNLEKSSLLICGTKRKGGGVRSLNENGAPWNWT